MGLLAKEDMVGPLTIHMMEALRAALHLNRGTFSFKELHPSDYDRSAFNPIDTHSLYNKVLLGEEEFLYLEKEVELAILDTEIDNLFLLPCGDIPPNPSELLASDRMLFLMSLLKKKFDILIIDSPPIMPTSDALIIGSHTDGVVLVNRLGANLIGVALNKVNVKKEGYYKYYHKYYSKYYGD
jgi:Mrp family chromosome partitioning ATPase